MAKKRKTLPKEFQQIVDAGNIDALKAVFEKCEINAYGGYSKNTALGFYGMPEEMLVWLVEQGADLEAQDIYGETPLHHHCGYRGTNILPLLVLGANIEAKDHEGLTPLHRAADSKNREAVRLLIERKADLYAQGSYQGQTPLEYALMRCSNIDIAAVVPIAQVFLQAGVTATEKMQQWVKKIGETFEFHRAGFAPEYLEEEDAALQQLYQLFRVPPVAHRKIHDGTSNITVSQGSWQKLHGELWEFLVPSSGCAKTVQGEVIRVTGRIAHEVLDNGGANWDGDFRKMLAALLGYFQMGQPLTQEQQQKAESCVGQLSQGDGDEEPAVLCELAVKWVQNNPQPLPCKKPDYRR